MENLSGPLEREEHRAGVELLQVVDLELDRRDDAEVPVAAAKRPEQVGLTLGIDASRTPVGGDDFDRGDAVRLEPVLPSEPAHSPAE